MIKATELRIGATFENNSNGLFDEGKYITLDRHHFYWAFETSQELETLLIPIPLTPEILEKCGYKGFLSFFEQENGIIELYFDSTTGIISYEIGGVTFSNVYYLHQLQNLHSALGGRELEIKELQHA